MTIQYNVKTEIVPFLLLAAAWALGAYFYAHFPAQVATHWNLSGQPDRYGSKFIGAFLLPGILTILYALFFVFPLLDPKRNRYGSFAKPYFIFRDIIIAVLLLIFIMTGAYNLGYAVNISTIAPLAVGLLFIVLGNYMGKIKPNWFIGIRNPWTLSNENVWNKTHRFGGYVFFVAGLAFFPLPLLPSAVAKALLVAVIICMILLPTLYSYLAYRQEQS